MKIPFQEPVSPKYIYINPTTNMVHILIPFVGGVDIGTDNTCKATLAQKEFVKYVAGELLAYKKALQFDLSFLNKNHPLHQQKKHRLDQIGNYISSYAKAHNKLLQTISYVAAKPSNLYSVQLRPKEQDPYSNPIKPVFTLNRANDAQGNPLSALYNALHEQLKQVVIQPQDNRSQLIKMVLQALPASPDFQTIQDILKEQCLKLFQVDIDFTKDKTGAEITQSYVDDLMGFDEDESADNYIDALLGFCAINLWESLQEPPFYSLYASTHEAEKIETLSILTQFFLAQVNIYCSSKDISQANFGCILDTNAALSNELVNVLCTALNNGEPVEAKLCHFINTKAAVFGLSRQLTEDEVHKIEERSTLNYRTVTANHAENPHMDDFIILDKDATGPDARFVVHQGAICLNFAELFARSEVIQTILKDFADCPKTIPHKNEWIHAEDDVVERDFNEFISIYWQGLKAGDMLLVSSFLSQAEKLEDKTLIEKMLLVDGQKDPTLIFELNNKVNRYQLINLWINSAINLEDKSALKKIIESAKNYAFKSNRADILTLCAKAAKTLDDKTLLHEIVEKSFKSLTNENAQSILELLNIAKSTKDKEFLRKLFSTTFYSGRYSISFTQKVFYEALPLNILVVFLDAAKELNDDELINQIILSSNQPYMPNASAQASFTFVETCKRLSRDASAKQLALACIEFAKAQSAESIKNILFCHRGGWKGGFTHACDNGHEEVVNACIDAAKMVSKEFLLIMLETHCHSVCQKMNENSLSALFIAEIVDMSATPTLYQGCANVLNKIASGQFTSPPIKNPLIILAERDMGLLAQTLFMLDEKNQQKMLSELNNALGVSQKQNLVNALCAFTNPHMNNSSTKVIYGKYAGFFSMTRIKMDFNVITNEELIDTFRHRAAANLTGASMQTLLTLILKEHQKTEATPAPSTPRMD